MPINWLNDLKIAILEKNYEKIDKLASSLPNFETLSELLCASDLVLEAKELLINEQKELQKAMIDLKKQRSFFEKSEKITSVVVV